MPLYLQQMAIRANHISGLHSVYVTVNDLLNCIIQTFEIAAMKIHVIYDADGNNM